MDRRDFLLTSLAGAFAVPLATSPLGPFLQAFEQRRRELGYVKGQNVAIEFRSAKGRVDRLPGLAAELVGLKVDVIVVATEPAARAAKGPTSTSTT